MVNIIIDLDILNEANVELNLLERKEKILNELISKNIKYFKYKEFELLVTYHLEILEEIGEINEFIDSMKK